MKKPVALSKAALTVAFILFATSNANATGGWWEWWNWGNGGNNGGGHHGGGNPNGHDVPLDGGLSLVAAAGIGVGARKMLKKRKQRSGESK